MVRPSTQAELVAMLAWGRWTNLHPLMQAIAHAWLECHIDGETSQTQGLGKPREYTWLELNLYSGKIYAVGMPSSAEGTIYPNADKNFYRAEPLQSLITKITSLGSQLSFSSFSSLWTIRSARRNGWLEAVEEPGMSGRLNATSSGFGIG